MSKNLKTDYQEQVYLRLKEHGSRIDAAEVDRYTKQAVETIYSKDSPKVSVVDKDGDGGFSYDLDSTEYTGWVNGFSTIQQVEYPLDTTTAATDLLEPDQWKAEQQPAGWKLIFVDDEPGATEDFRVWYTRPYLFDGSDNVDIPDQDFHATCDLAAALCLQTIASFYLSTIQATGLVADRVDNQNKMRDALALAKHYRGQYDAHLGIPEKGKSRPAMGEREFDTEYAWGGTRITHGLRGY